jgi:pyridoxamine 5'-phosphate oxidase
VIDPLLARKNYLLGSLDDANVAADPFDQFRAWFSQAAALDPLEANAMVLATTDPAGQPSARMVLLRAYDTRGFVFFTNYRSAKAQELAATPKAALLFYWAGLERQVRIEGGIERISDAESDAYFASRPREHRLSTWASDQSRPVPDRAFLEERRREIERRFADREVDRPPRWGGYRVIPGRFEFWQGRAARLHDRIAYERGDGGWARNRLAP